MAFPAKLRFHCKSLLNCFIENAMLMMVTIRANVNDYENLNFKDHPGMC